MTEYKSWTWGPLNGEASPEHDEPHHRNNASATAKFASDLRSGIPPRPVILDTFLAAEGWTVLYANGGTGKGMVAIWWMSEFLDLHADDDVDIAILDYEDHEWEWGSRIINSTLFTPEQQQRIHYVRPMDVLDKGLDGIREVVRDFDVGLWIVDSYAYAAATGDKMGGGKEARDFFRATTFLPGIGLVLAHTSDQARHAAKPYGSVYIHNAARETWSAAKNDIDQPYVTPGTIVIGPNAKMQLELVNKKRSVGANTLIPQLVTFTFWPSGKIEIEHSQGKEPTVGDRILDILSDGKGYTASQVATALGSDGGGKVSTDTVKKNLQRLEDRSQIATEGTLRPYKHYSPQARTGSTNGTPTTPPYGGEVVSPSLTGTPKGTSSPTEGDTEGDTLGLE